MIFLRGDKTFKTLPSFFYKYTLTYISRRKWKCEWAFMFKTIFFQAQYLLLMMFNVHYLHTEEHWVKLNLSSQSLYNLLAILLTTLFNSVESNVVVPVAQLELCFSYTYRSVVNSQPLHLPKFTGARHFHISQLLYIFPMCSSRREAFVILSSFSV